MPAATVQDLLTLPRLDSVDPAVSHGRVVRGVANAPGGYEGEGFPVKRAFRALDLAETDPFIMMDEMGEVDYAPGEPKGTPWHPHRGFETVTYMIDGTFQHQDSIGGGGLISDGDTQWMTAGAGILHIERPPDELVASGGLFHGTQLWVNLPSTDKMVAPRYQDIGSTQIKLITSPDGGALVRIIAGSVGGHDGPGNTYTPINYLHATIMPGAQLRIPWQNHYNALVYGLSGSGTVGEDQVALGAAQTAVLGSADRTGTVDLQANSGHITIGADQAQNGAPFDVMILGGQPISEPIAWSGPFVMNTKDQLMQAFEDYQSGAMGQEPVN